MGSDVDLSGSHIGTPPRRLISSPWVVTAAGRQYPSPGLVDLIDRVCTIPYTIKQVTAEEKPVHIEKGTIIWVPTYAIHRSPKYYPDPDRFDPERFNDENKENIKPYTYMPFGLGPRNCIGSRLALLEIKIVFFFILKHFELVPVEKTQIPLEISKKTFALSAANGFWLRLKLTMLFLILGAAIVALLFYYLFVKPLDYWKERGVKQGKPMWIFGDSAYNIFRLQSFSELMQNAYNQTPGTRYFGMYQFATPTLVVKDPDLIKHITVKDFDHFTDHRTFVPENSDPLWSKNLLALKGQPWHDMRSILSPSFTSSKMRSMFVLMLECADNFVQNFLKEDKEMIKVEMKEIFTRFTNDVIATTAFGVKVDSIAEPNNEFYLMGKDATTHTFWKGVVFKLRLFSTKISNFFGQLINDTIKIREERAIVRPDMIHLLMEARKGTQKHEENGIIDTGFATAQESDLGKAKVTKDLSNEDITAQALIFFFAGFDTVSTLMSFTAYELAVNQNAQEKLRKEIYATLEECEGQLTYEYLSKMKYMDMVVSETLRKWPSAVATDRGALLSIPIFAIHRCPKYYPDPDRFDPERFSDENKGNIKPYTYMPFGVGPRNCIGSRFALLEIKVVLFSILQHFELVPIEKTQIPLEISKKVFPLSAANGFWLGMKRIKN
ncbi:hypothetical protein NQ314_019098 [Rhamnusium bicolor]|uniref:Cytochrome P450 n=1 Tax=Rhamnusium bicolor TaxID=1586634 RepID=A0AAV8WP20_9CUCU|nr:hypothetical protein NQ314_019098 [Rhamnusium bicolor]